MAGHLWLIGMMGAGKTTVGRLVAERRGAAFADIDEHVVATQGCTVAELWERRGEQAFRELEAEAVQRMAHATERHVIATGGGAVLRADSVAAMRGSGTVVWLTAAPSDLAARTGDGTERPLLAGRSPQAQLAEILAAREPAYRGAAHAVVDTGHRTMDAVAEAVEAAWARI